MREHVKEPAARGLAERQEVAPPDLLGAAAGFPDAELVHVEGALAHEVHGADHVVEGARLQHVRRLLLAAGEVVGLDAEAQVGVLAHEGAVGVEIVVRVGGPERVLPDRKRLREAVDVLGDAELLDAALTGGAAVALRVCLREVLAGAGLVRVAAQV